MKFVSINIRVMQRAAVVDDGKKSSCVRDRVSDFNRYTRPTTRLSSSTNLGGNFLHSKWLLFFPSFLSARFPCVCFRRSRTTITTSSFTKRSVVLQKNLIYCRYGVPQSSSSSSRARHRTHTASGRARCISFWSRRPKRTTGLRTDIRIY